MEMKRKRKITGAAQIRPIVKAEVTILKQKAQRLHLVRNIFFCRFYFEENIPTWEDMTSERNIWTNVLT
jgi:hypothetical protein